jgi:hypothetical protein
MAHAAKLGALTDDLITSITPSTRVRLFVLNVPLLFVDSV